MNLRIYIRTKKVRGTGDEVCIAARPTKDESAVWNVDRAAGIRILASALERTKDHAIKAICDDKNRIVVVQYTGWDEAGQPCNREDDVTIGHVMFASKTKRRV